MMGGVYCRCHEFICRAFVQGLEVFFCGFYRFGKGKFIVVTLKQKASFLQVINKLYILGYLETIVNKLIPQTTRSCTLYLCPCARLDLLNITLYIVLLRIILVFLFIKNMNSWGGGVHTKNFKLNFMLKYKIQIIININLKIKRYFFSDAFS